MICKFSKSPTTIKEKSEKTSRKWSLRTTRINRKASKQRSISNLWTKIANKNIKMTCMPDILHKKKKEEKS